MVEYTARFPRGCHRRGPLSYSKRLRLFTPGSDLEITRHLFGSRSNSAGAILLGPSTNQAETGHRPVHNSLCVSLVQCGPSLCLVRCEFGVDRRMAEFAGRHSDPQSVSAPALFFKASQWFDAMSPNLVGLLRRAMYKLSDNYEYLGRKKRDPEKEKVY